MQHHVARPARRLLKQKAGSFARQTLRANQAAQVEPLSSRLLPERRSDGIQHDSSSIDRVCHNSHWIDSRRLQYHQGDNRHNSELFLEHDAERSVYSRRFGETGGKDQSVRGSGVRKSSPGSCCGERAIRDVTGHVVRRASGKTGRLWEGLAAAACGVVRDRPS